MMTWSAVLTQEFHRAYGSVERLLELVEPGDLAWAPPGRACWMTVGQLLGHLGSAGSQEAAGFVSGDWRTAPGMVTPVTAIPEARSAVAAEREKVLALVTATAETRLAGERVPAPWDGSRVALGMRLLGAARHLQQHGYQLFFYLKLLGRPVTSAHLGAS